MFDDEIISLYLHGNCHLLTYYLARHFNSQQIYVLTDQTIRSGRYFKPEVVHSYFYQNDLYYDIEGPHHDPEIIINEWKDNNMLNDQHVIELRPINSLEELDLNSYDEADHYEAYLLIKEYLKIYLD